MDDRQRRHLISQLDPRNLAEPVEPGQISPEQIVPLGPPKAAVESWVNGQRPCGDGRFNITWTQGPAVGETVTTYCAEPLCRETGRCTGPRFVPHMTQFKRDGTTARRVTIEESVMAARAAADEARRQTGVPDRRSDKEIELHVRTVRRKTIASLQSGGSLS